MKGKKILTLIGVLVLLVSVLGLTYAFFLSSRRRNSY